MGLINFLSRIFIKFTATVIVLSLLTAILVGILYYTDIGGSREFIIEKYQVIHAHYSNGEEYLVNVK